MNDPTGQDESVILGIICQSLVDTEEERFVQSTEQEVCHVLIFRR